MTARLADWIAGQARRCATAMEGAISATHLTRQREAFGQVVRPSPGSVLASPEFADWDPEPDYFFHWLRDSAIVMRTVVDLMADAPDAAERQRWQGHFEDFAGFSAGLLDLDGAAFVRQSCHRETTRPESRRHLRPEAELGALRGDGLLGESRFNADGTLDFLLWGRPQYDGPALRALACLRFLAAGGPPSADLGRLLRRDLDFTLRHAGAPCVGPWEEAEPFGRHYYVGVVQLGALVHGRAWIDDEGARSVAEAGLRAGLDLHWSEARQVYAAVQGSAAEGAEDLVDASTLLAVLDADLPDGRHSASDPRVEATQAALEAMFAREMPINHGRPPSHAPALGRWRTDRYFGGGAWYPTTLAAAALCYRRGDIAGGDAFMATVRRFIPADGSMTEQVDRATGQPISARHLTWSYAAFVGAARDRAQAVRRSGGRQGGGA